MIIKNVDECTSYPTMTIKGGTSQACAACKYQRRRCAKDCPLAPHFPADQPKMFQNAHRLYGVANILKILKEVNDDQKEEAMRSIIYESNMRARFPATGCMGIINELNLQLQQAVDQLHYWRTNLAFYKEQCQYRIPSSPPHYSCPSSQLQLGINNNNNMNPINTNDPVSPPLTIYQYGGGGGGGSCGMTSLAASEYLANGIDGVHIDDGDTMVKPHIRVTHQHNPNPNYYGDHNNVDQLLAVQSNIYYSDYDDIPYTIADDRQSYIESKEACESSAESSFKGTTQSSMEHVSQNDLKSAAACFSLTSVK